MFVDQGFFLFCELPVPSLNYSIFFYSLLLGFVYIFWVVILLLLLCLRQIFSPGLCVQSSQTRTPRVLKVTVTFLNVIPDELGSHGPV